VARTVQYLGVGGATAGVPNRVDPEYVVRSWVQFTKTIPAWVAVGMAERETGFALNELDTEDSGFQSLGIFQLSRAEAIKAFRPEADLYSLDDSSAVLATILERNLDRILEIATDAASRGLGKMPISSGVVIDDVWPFLALSHNLGLGNPENPNPGGAGVLPGIAHYGLNWPATFATAHPSMLRQLAYGDAALTGGSSWREEFAQITPPENASTGAGTRMVILVAAGAAGALWLLTKGWWV
jgi:hypothetical protein